jgi:hypothetical protein
MNSRTSFLNLAPSGILADLFDVARRDPELALAYTRLAAWRAEVAARNKLPRPGRRSPVPPRLPVAK